ncbi:MAG: DMT family transporter [Oscillospiraceae bacterium]|nr:DMT family transporter [Oscillospiraceae bacterium]
MSRTETLSTTGGMLAAAVTANLLWGSASPAIKLGYRFFAIAAEDTMSVILFAGVRFTLAGLLTILLGSLLRRRILLPKRGSGGMILALAMMQTVIQYAFFYIGLSHAPASMGSIISPTSTFFALLIAALVFRQEKLTAKKLLGCLIGFAGVLAVSLNGRLEGGVSLEGEGFLVLAAASYGCASVLIKRFSVREDPVVLSAWQFVLGGGLMTAAGLLGGGKLHAVSAAAWPLMIYLALVSAVAYTLWSLLLQRYPVSRVAVFSFLNPVFGVVLSALLLGEARVLDLPRCLLAMVLVCLGVWIVNRPEKQA